MSYGYDDKPVGPDLSHPDAMIRLASVVHRFRCPETNSAGSKKLSYVQAFKTSSSQHPTTQELMRKSDASRGALLEALAGSRSDSSNQSMHASPISYESVVNATSEYVPYVNAVLLSCKVQPDTARLDERLLFDWTSGIESIKQRKSYKSEALMYELVMCIATQGLGTAGVACDESTSGDFPAASRQFKMAAGIFEYLAQDQLPKWMARGASVNVDELPSEITPGVCESLKLLFLACAQQMAVATVLVKPGTPNYGLLAKLTLGIGEQIDNTVSTFRSKSSRCMEVIDGTFFTLLAFQTTFQRGLSLYFLSRAEWEDSEYGVAIGLLREAITTLQTRATPTGRGLPETDKRSGLSALEGDLITVRQHMDFLLRTWQKDNSSIYFDKVPNPIPEDRKLANGMNMMKVVKFGLSEDVEPYPLSLPSRDARPPVSAPLMPPPMAASAPPPPPPMMPPMPVPTMQRTDSDLARELQAKFDAGEDL